MAAPQKTLETPRTGAKESGWYLLIHQLPPRPLYLRARIRQRLDRVGAIALKNSVYILPDAASCLEDFQWIAQEAVAGGGEAFICGAEFIQGLDAAEVIERFQHARAADYIGLINEARETLTLLRQRKGGRSGSERSSGLKRLKRRLREVVGIDFFGAQERGSAEAAVHALEVRVQPPSKAAGSSGGKSHSELVGKTWVTRKGVHVDRIASAWLIRRFVDPAAPFRFVDAHETAPEEGELRFDMVNGDFTHQGDHCTFESLVAHLQLRDLAVLNVAEIVHDIDLKDGKFARPEAAGVEQLLSGLCRAHAEDQERLERGFQLFDDLYRAYSKPTELQADRQRRQPRTGAKR